MKNKGMLIIITILFLLTLGAGITGLYYSKNNKPKDTKPVDPGKITYEYYLENQKVDEMPVNEKTLDENGNEIINKIYDFLSFDCSENVSGDFDTEKWEFIPSEEKNSVCKLYFVKSKYEVTITPTNGILTEENDNNTILVDREQNAIIKVTPNEGYTFSEASCTNDKEATWNESNQSLIINAVSSDVACKVVFKIKDLKADITVVNGNGNTTENVKYGDTISIVVEPKDGFTNPKIECTNNQIARFDNNKLIIDKLTDNTSCKVTFKEVPVEKYSLQVEVPSQVTIIAGNKTQEIESGRDGTFTLKVEEGYTMNISCNNDVIPKIDDIDPLTKKYTFLNIKKDISCEITTKRSE